MFVDISSIALSSTERFNGCVLYKFIMIKRWCLFLLSSGKHLVHMQGEYLNKPAIKAYIKQLYHFGIGLTIKHYINNVKQKLKKYLY